jgi:2-hydroxy-3-keto-5-methylthiopentenyl-1-phosphate phosphatase
MKKRRTIIFSDFDGTFTERDVGYQLFRHFSQDRNMPLVEQWKKGLVSSRDCLLQEAAMVSPTLEEIYSFLDKFSLSAGVVEFYQTIKRRNIPFYIVSDGLDIYLEYVLKKHGLDEIRFFCNRGIVKDRRLVLDFPYDN